MLLEESNRDASQIIAYFGDKELFSIGYPADLTDYENIIVGLICYSSNYNEEYEVSEEDTKIVKKILDNNYR